MIGTFDVKTFKVPVNEFSSLLGNFPMPLLR